MRAITNLSLSNNMRRIKRAQKKRNQRVNPNRREVEIAASGIVYIKRYIPDRVKWT